MEQLSFSFVKNCGRTLPPREITSIYNPVFYMEKCQLRLKFSTHKSGCGKYKGILFGKQKRMPCIYCGKRLRFNEATVEHIVGRAFGGKNDLDNLAISCGPCNNHRQEYSHEEWKRIVSSGANSTSYIKFYNLLKGSARLIERRYLK